MYTRTPSVPSVWLTALRPSCCGALFGQPFRCAANQESSTKGQEGHTPPPTMSSPNATDPAALAATRQSSKTAPPTPSRDGFHLVPSHPVVYDVDMSSDFTDITYNVSTIDCCARIAFDRPQVLHAFRPTTINEVRRALELAQDDTRVGGKWTWQVVVEYVQGATWSWSGEICSFSLPTNSTNLR